MSDLEILIAQAMLGEMMKGEILAIGKDRFKMDLTGQMFLERKKKWGRVNMDTYRLQSKSFDTACQGGG